RDGLDGPSVLALGCSQLFRKASAGYSGYSDGWQDIRQHGRMRWEFASAPDGDVALTAELDLDHEPTTFVFALGFGTTVAGAGLNVRAALVEGFDSAHQAYVRQWGEWQKTLDVAGNADLGSAKIARVSAAVLRIHEAKDFCGAIVASLST